MKKLGVSTAIFLTIVLVFSIITITHASPDIVYSDLSDGYVESGGFAFDLVDNMRTGDKENNQYRQSFVKFSLAGITGVDAATLYIYVQTSWRDSVEDNTSPLANPGLGDCVVRHIGDYGTLDTGDLNAPSIGNDPVGALIGGTVTPSVGYVSIDVTAAMQDDITNGRAFSTFMIRLSTNTDNDDRWDQWVFYTSDDEGTDRDPYIDYTASAGPPPVGGVVSPVNKLAIIAPYLALAGLIAAVSTVYVIKKRKD